MTRAIGLLLAAAGCAAAQSDAVLGCLAAFLPHKVCPIVGAYPEYIDEYEFSPDKLTDQGHVTWNSDSSFATVYTQSGGIVHKTETFLRPDRFVSKILHYRNASDTLDYEETYLFRDGLPYEHTGKRNPAYFFYKNGRLDSIAETRQSEINYYKLEYDADGLIRTRRFVVHDTSSGYHSESRDEYAFHFPDSITLKSTLISPSSPVVREYDTSYSTVYLANHRIYKLVGRGSRANPTIYTLIYRYSDDIAGIGRGTVRRRRAMGTPYWRYQVDLLGRNEAHTRH
jgi:hypothetical protein